VAETAPTVTEKDNSAVTLKTRATTTRGRKSGHGYQAGLDQSEANETTTGDSAKARANLHPDKASFRIPITREDHVQMVLRLVEAGSIEMEAERIIATRISSYNKALKEFKKNEKLSQVVKTVKTSSNINKQNHAN
jgi:hypothetical protein